jgi:hypothetical protein
MAHGECECCQEYESERERWAKWAILAAEVAPLKALLAAQEARAQRVEAALHSAGLVLTAIAYSVKWELAPEVLAEVRTAAEQARAALSQPADERGGCDPECVHCASWRAK